MGWSRVDKQVETAVWLRHEELERIVNSSVKLAVEGSHIFVRAPFLGRCGKEHKVLIILVVKVDAQERLITTVTCSQYLDTYTTRLYTADELLPVLHEIKAGLRHFQLHAVDPDAFLLKSATEEKAPEVKVEAKVEDKWAGVTAKLPNWGRATSKGIMIDTTTHTWLWPRPGEADSQQRSYTLVLTDGLTRGTVQVLIHDKTRQTVLCVDLETEGHVINIDDRVVELVRHVLPETMVLVEEKKEKVERHTFGDKQIRMTPEDARTMLEEIIGPRAPVNRLSTRQHAKWPTWVATIDAMTLDGMAKTRKYLIEAVIPDVIHARFPDGKTNTNSVGVACEWDNNDWHLHVVCDHGATRLNLRHGGLPVLSKAVAGYCSKVTVMQFIEELRAALTDAVKAIDSFHNRPFVLLSKEKKP